MNKYHKHEGVVKAHLISVKHKGKEAKEAHLKAIGQTFLKQQPNKNTQRQLNNTQRKNKTAGFNEQEVSSVDVVPNGIIVKFDKERLENMLAALENSNAQEIGTLIKLE